MEEEKTKKLQEEILNLEKEPEENIEKNIDQEADIKKEAEENIEKDIDQATSIEKEPEENIEKDIDQATSIEKEPEENIEKDIDQATSIEKEPDIGLMNKEMGQREELRKDMEEEREQGDEKMEFLKREDIKTMKKDIRKLREIEAGKESSKMSFLGTKKDKPKEEITTKKEEIATKEEEVISRAPIMPKFSKKTSSSNKLFIRIVFVFIAILIGGGAYWFFSTQEKVIVDIQPGPEEKEEVNIPKTFATIISTFSFDLEEKQKIISAMELLSPDNLAENGLTRLIIKDSEEQLVTLDNMEKLFGIKLSSEILEKIDQENFNLLAIKRSGKIEKSLIIKTTAKVSSPDLKWEETIEDELITLEEGEERSSLFEDFQSENKDVRCLTSSSEYQLTLCYTGISDYFIISESFDAIQPTIAGLNDVTRKRIGQLFIVGFEGTVMTPELEAFFKKYYPGGVLLLSKNILSSHQIAKLNEELQTLSLQTTEQPLLIAIDQEGGLVSRIDFLDELTAQSEIEESTSAYQIGLKRGEELKELGINLNLSPLMDNASKDDYIYNRSFQKDPELTGEIGKSLILGQQEAGIFSAIKHFPGYTGMATNPEEKLMIAPSFPIIVQFEEALKVEPAFVMTANAIYEDIDSRLPFTFSETAIDYLKDNLGRGILILSDDLSQNSLLNSYTLKEIVANPINAGVDLEIISGYRSSVNEALDAFLNAVNDQEVSLEKIDKAILRIIQLKKEL